MKTIGIVADDYKLAVYKAELVKGGFTDFSITKYSSTASMIEIKVPPILIIHVSRICALIEAHFTPLD